MLLVIHMDPVETRDLRVIQARGQVEQILNALDPAVSIHDFRMVSGEEKVNLIFDMEVPFEYDEKKVMDYIRMEEREEGRKEGRGEEARKYNRLIICLNNEGKGEMIVEAARDDELRERLFEEYGL